MVAARSPTAETSLNPGPIRVLVVTPRFFPEVGGVETHTLEITRRIAERADINVTVLTTDRSGALPSVEEGEGYTILRCRSYPRRSDYYFAPAIYRRILDGNYHLVHCQGIHTATPILAIAAARRYNIPYVVTFHTGGHSSGLRRLLRNTHWRLLGPMLRDAAILVAVSPFERRLLARLCRLDSSKIRVVPNGGGLPADITGGEGRIPGRIVSVGRLERYKGHQRVIQAMPAVRRTYPDATLRILGSGPYERKLRALVAKLGLVDCVAVEYIPAGNREGMAVSLGRAAVLATLSDYESHPVAVIEALAAGVPAVALEVAGLVDLVADGLVEGIPRNATSATIARTLIDVLGRGSAPPVPDLPTWNAAASAVADIYLEAAGILSGRYGQ